MFGHRAVVLPCDGVDRGGPLSVGRVPRKPMDDSRVNASITASHPGWIAPVGPGSGDVGGLFEAGGSGGGDKGKGSDLPLPDPPTGCQAAPTSGLNLLPLMIPEPMDDSRTPPARALTRLWPDPPRGDFADDLSVRVVGQPAGESRVLLGVRRHRSVSDLSVCLAGLVAPPLISGRRKWRQIPLGRSPWRSSGLPLGSRPP